MNNKFPLINFSLFEFTRRIFKSGGISLKGIFLLLVYYFQIILSLNFKAKEYECKLKVIFTPESSVNPEKYDYILLDISLI
jgi:hypothetical protein